MAIQKPVPVPIIKQSSVTQTAGHINKDKNHGPSSHPIMTPGLGLMHSQMGQPVNAAQTTGKTEFLEMLPWITNSDTFAEKTTE